ncbi:hypothetical protein AGDE_16682 [Angomonas deanei]|uniref:Uncharacterized protein n=1 Tax=Angomonas deanei TaxID=59799 RepID=A0A7G2CDX7_9TRYP|nr:hypothetical protein AGDE_16682 [Angomonas deanei]CAD2216342.1 hypothetical protein, conserved [Angomonas deanei]|eukprot:EPY16631.1 hypothetical protein AGDE_16682 [Angomonas deanei]
MEQGEEREKTTKFQQELKTLSEGIHDDTSLVLADLQKCNAPFLNKVVQSRWEAIGTTEEPLVFSSVLGHAPEDGHTKRQKSVSHS